ncbi:MAG: GNAT family N-acetyltransferase [Albidovulum sp.]|uniref:GNAT family N-acetyltransferase n=1 Tax=Albidovulum sp. TaxID=1872424 RepID=UPI003CB626D0
MKIVWDRIDRREWGQAAAGAGLPMQQHWSYGDALSALGRQVSRGEILRHGRRVGLVQVASRRTGPVTLSLIGRGPVWLEDLPADEAVMACRMIARGVGLTVMTPERALHGAGLIPLVTARHQAVLDLRPDLADLRAGLAGKWRNRLVRAEGAGLSVGQGAATAAALEDLLARDATQQRLRGYHTLPGRFTRTWEQIVPGGTRLYQANYEDQTIATMLLLLHRPAVTYHIGWSGQEGRQLNAHQLLLWQATRDLKADGYTTLDLGDVNTEDAPGLARFKIGSGARIAALGATMLVLPRLTRPRS